MFIVVGLMLLGVIAGRLLRRQRLPGIQQVIMALIWLLLFLLGLEVGSNPEIIRNFHTLGVEAILISLLAVLGSATAALFLWRWSAKSDRKEEKKS